MRQFANRPLLYGSTGPVPKQIAHLTFLPITVQIEEVRHEEGGRCSARCRVRRFRLTAPTPLPISLMGPIGYW
ncbi:hypothetical protein, partial [uncultured Deinococcus sp.]|uniref:hypothetical protein n=1 Tax=uncultured Deinococcus sp. TaxID=158789 RepID=UPI00258BA2D8